MAPELAIDSASGQSLLKLARETLFESGKEGPLKRALDRAPEGSPLRRVLPCFVSLFTTGSRLRGCIGCTSTEDTLAENVHRFVQLAAWQDPRFQPVRFEEIRHLQIRISVLGPSAPLPSLDSLEIGRHGLSVRKGHRRGVLLAEVATQFGWTRERFLQETFRKAGLASNEPDVEISYFEEAEIKD